VPVPRAKTANPRQQGLKQYTPISFTLPDGAKTANPRQQGLKPLARREEREVEEGQNG